jgi:5-methylcytosine-specific restriction endonuclease McrA
MKVKKYKDLLNENEFLTYSEKLNTFEWRNKRNYIVHRDNFLCTNCKSEPTKFEYGKPVRQKTEKEIQEYKDYLGKLWFDSVKEEYKKEYDPENPPWFLQKEIRIPLHEEDNPVILHVHHKYYVLNNLPWEYPNEDLITLCHNCHQGLHNETEIDIFTDLSKTKKVKVTICERCNGSGYLPEFHYYENGICFSCNGEKYQEVK